MKRLLAVTALCLVSITAVHAGPKVGPVQFGTPKIAPKHYIAPQPKINPYIAPQPETYVPKLGFTGQFVPGKGLMVLHVHHGGIASKKGFETGDFFVSINGEKILSHDHYMLLMQKAMIYHGGHARVLVRNARPYPPYVSVDLHLHSEIYPVGVGY